MDGLIAAFGGSGAGFLIPVEGWDGELKISESRKAELRIRFSTVPDFVLITPWGMGFNLTW